MNDPHITSPSNLAAYDEEQEANRAAEPNPRQHSKVGIPWANIRIYRDGDYVQDCSIVTQDGEEIARLPITGVDIKQRVTEPTIYQFRLHPTRVEVVNV